MYNHMVAMERRVDSVMQRKRAAITAALFAPETAQRKIRLYFYNTHSRQQASPGTSGAAKTSELEIKAIQYLMRCSSRFKS